MREAQVALRRLASYDVDTCLHKSPHVAFVGLRDTLTTTRAVSRSLIPMTTAL